MIAKIVKLVIDHNGFKKATYLVWGSCEAINSLALYQAVEDLTRLPPFTVILTANAMPDSSGKCHRFVLKPCKEVQKNNGIYAPIEDGDIQPFTNFALAVTSVVKNLIRGRGVFVCCDGGIGRSNTVVYTALSLLSGKCPLDIVEEIYNSAIVMQKTSKLKSELVQIDKKIVYFRPEAIKEVWCHNNMCKQDSELCNRAIEVFQVDKNYEDRFCSSPQVQYLLGLCRINNELQKI